MPKIVDKEQKRIKIIEAAVRVFARMGFANTKMLNIAQAAGIGKGTIYEYFKSKDELFIAAFNAFVKEMDRLISRRVIRIEDPEQKMRAYFDGWTDLLETDFMEFAEICLDMWAEGMRKERAGTSTLLNDMYREYRTLIIKILEDGIRQGRFKPINTTITASIIIGTLDGLLLQWVMDRNIYHMREAIKQLSDIIIDGLTEAN